MDAVAPRLQLHLDIVSHAQHGVTARMAKVRLNEGKRF
jgi:hypothetical protein